MINACIHLGQCISRFSNQKTAYCLAFNPDDDKQHLFIAGCVDKKIYTVSQLVVSNTVNNNCKQYRKQ